MFEALQTGAKGNILKSGALRQIGGDILAVLEGGSPISPSIARHLLWVLTVGMEPKPKAAQSVLTKRETEILRAVTRGYKRHQIGTELDISAGTVGTHIKNIYHKLEVGSNMKAVVRATKIGVQ